MSKAVLIISIACMLFLLGLQIVYYFSINYQIIQVLGEMVTISSIVFVIFAFVFSFINILKGNKEYYLIFGVNIFTILMVSIVTISDYN